MIRPNLAMDEPPASIEVGGSSYGIDVDFRTWIQVQELTREVYSQPETDEERAHNLEIIAEMESLVFGGVLKDENPYEALAAMCVFLRGYPSAPVQGPARETEPVVSFYHDLNEIIIAIRNQSGIDLSYRRKEPFHWWEFLLEFNTLCGEHHVLRIMQIRGYEDDSAKGADHARKEAIALKHRFALPYEETADERKKTRELEKMMGE